MARTESPSPLSARVSMPSSDIRTMTTAFGTVDIYSRDPAFVLAVTGRYIIQLVRQRATMTLVSLAGRATADLANRYEKFGYIGIIDPNAELSMPPDVRNGFNNHVKRYSPRYTGAAIVFEKTGFHATAVRSVVTAINLASRATHPSRVFADLREGLYWLTQLTPGEPTATGLTHVIQQLRTSA